MLYFRSKCTKFDFGPAGGAHSAPPDPVTGFERILLLMGGKGMGGKGGEEEKEEGERGGRGRKGEVASWLGEWTPLT